MYLCSEMRYLQNADLKGNTGEIPGQSRCCISMISVQDERRSHGRNKRH